MGSDKVLVTGGSGLLGRFVTDELTRDGPVGILDVKAPPDGPGFHHVDIRDLDQVRDAVRGYDRIIHLAGIDDGVDVPDHTYFLVNVQGTWNLLRAAEETGVRKVVIASSTAATGLAADAHPDYLPIDEAHPQRPRRTYDLTKQLIESTARSFARRGDIGSIVCLRPTLIVRPIKAPEILAELATLSPEDGHPGFAVDAPLYGGLPLIRSYVTSRDAARAFRAALNGDTDRFGVYLVAARDSLGRVDTIDFLSRVNGMSPQVRDVAWFDPRHASPIDTRAAERDLGWVAEDDWLSVAGAVRAGGA